MLRAGVQDQRNRAVGLGAWVVFAFEPAFGPVKNDFGNSSYRFNRQFAGSVLI
jgi:hypothetical protein